MKLPFTVVILLPLLTHCRPGTTTPLAPPIPLPISPNTPPPTLLANATFVPLQYTGPITPGGKDISLNGTAQEIHTQIQQLNPHFRPEDFDGLDTRGSATGIERRNKLPPWCDPPGIGQSSGTATGDNLWAMERLPGRCSVPAGPRVCTRLACAFGGGVFLCNDETQAIEPSCLYLSGYVFDVLSSCCKVRLPWVFDCYGAGQVFDSDGYNVIVAAQDC